MDAITSPKGTYRNPPDGRLPAKCPSCNAILEHFLQTAPVGEAPPSIVEPELIGVPELMQILPQQVAAEEPYRQTLPPVPVHQAAASLGLLDRATLGGKITICVLLYGEFAHLHRRCINSIIATVPHERIDLRIACNQVKEETRQYLKNLPVTKVYYDDGVRRKYPAMRQMFWDKDCPITTPYVIWFDDDSYVRKPTWLALLAETVLQQPAESNIGMYGIKLFHPLQSKTADPRRWFQQATWWRQRPFQDRHGKPSPNGNCIHFVHGAFWAASMKAIRDADVPDVRLNHNGGDVTIGAQIYQAGYNLKSFNGKKELIHASAHSRRGHHERFPFYS